MSQLELFDQPLPDVVTVLTMNQAMKLFVKLYWGKKKMYRRTKWLISYIVQFFDGRFVETLGRQDIENLRVYLTSKNHSPSYVNKAHMLVTRLYNKLEDWKEDVWADGRNFKDILPGLQIVRFKALRVGVSP